MINDEYFKNKFKSNQIHQSKINKLSENEIDYLKNRYNDSLSIKETIFRILNNIDKHPICPECGNPVQVKYRKEKPFFSTCCSNECIHKRKGNGPKEACIKKYGKINVFQLDSVKQKIENHHFKKYGYKSHTQSEIWKNKYIENLKNKYGVINNFQRPEIKEKIKNICLEKYGVDHYSKSNDFKEKMSIIASSEEFQNKRNKTLNENKTWNSSKIEDNIYDELHNIFKDTIRQYSSIKYPYSCDFYIPQLDLYIEYQGSDLHNFKPFLGNNKDINELNLLKQKSENLKKKTGCKKTRYDNRIYTWSILDVKKRNIAKENNLNYIEFWCYDDFTNWIKKYI